MRETIKVRLVSICFSVLVLAIFKPFGLQMWQWEAYAHLVAIGLLGVTACLLTELLLKYVVRMPRSMEQDVDYIIRRNLWFQCVNTLLVSMMICLYRHFVLSGRIESNRLSWANFFETLVIMAFCSFAIGLYWRYKFRSRYLIAELEETQLLNEQLSRSQQGEEIATPTSAIVTLKGTTSESVTLQIAHLIYIEAVGNYVKVYHWRDDRVQTNMLRATSRQMEETLLSYPMIVRCHRAFLVNLGQVEQVISQSGTMQLLMKHCHDTIPVSRSNMAPIKDAIKQI